MGLPVAGEMPASSLQGAAVLGHHVGMHRTSPERTSWIVERARAIGFDLCGVAPALAFEELSQLPEWIERGYAGEMAYLRDPRRGDPSLVMPGARSVIVVALNYNSAGPYSTAPRDGRAG
jgi:epoxyqueuosine reductase QueG